MSENGQLQKYEPGGSYKKMDVLEHPKHGVMIVVASDVRAGKLTAMVNGKMKSFIQNREYVESLGSWIIKNEDEIDD
jgi:hypothetical protein